jgi:hypothetical protein
MVLTDVCHLVGDDHGDLLLKIFKLFFWCQIAHVRLQKLLESIFDLIQKSVELLKIKFDFPFVHFTFKN